jgi:cellulose synthase/poly-beta-1,6-N-acetylglucosamine synthase-like glycosyltransferase
LIELLRARGLGDVSAFESPDVGEGDIILTLRRKRLKVDELFFQDLAKELGLPFVGRERLKGFEDLAVIMPYGLLKENLILPLEISPERAKIATANPLNAELFSLLEGILGRKVEICVSSIEAIEEAIDKGYERIHKYRALKDLHYRSPDDSAFMVLYPWQRLFIIGSSLVFIILFIVNYPASFILIFSIINIIYFCINPVKFYISLKGFLGSRRAIHVSDEDVAGIHGERLPVYTILIPLYKEAQILPNIIRNIRKMDYPPDRLDVKILIEEKDSETLEEAKRLGLLGEEFQTKIVLPFTARVSTGVQGVGKPSQSMRVIDSNGIVVGKVDGFVSGDGLPEALLIVKDESGRQMEIPYGFVKSVRDVVLLREGVDRLIEMNRDLLRIFDLIVVPEADIMTKPRACNYGLLRATGDYCVIFDAEDDPEPDQLKKAVVAFQRLGREFVCLQSHLNFYNPKVNLLTRFFSLEYSYWFDHYLNGLDKVGAPLPLGGTSNHFRTKSLRELGGWDPYNMTEDADLGVRISRRGLRTAMLNSYTFEEANSKLWNWIRQRSRWNKGYIQTYLVHMRHPRRLIRELGWKRFLFFQLTFGGNIFLPLVNPMLWAVTILTLLFPGIFQFLFFYPIVYICIFNLVIGNLVYILLHLGPIIIKKNYTSIPLAFAIPLYWVLISVGAWKGAIQLVTRPFYWEKSDHGLSKPRGGIPHG